MACAQSCFGKNGADFCAATLEHDPEPVCGKRSCSNKNLDHDPDSTWSDHGLRVATCSAAPVECFAQRVVQRRRVDRLMHQFITTCSALLRARRGNAARNDQSWNLKGLAQLLDDLNSIATARQP